MDSIKTVLMLTKWNALLSGLTLCFSIYLIRLQLVYLKEKYYEISVIDVRKFTVAKVLPKRIILISIKKTCQDKKSLN